MFVGRTGIFRKFSDEAIVFASYLVRINPDPEIITPECLTAFLNTKYGVLDVKRRARISMSFNSRKQSKHLLECAKRAVELAIEQDEQTAIDWLENERSCL